MRFQANYMAVKLGEHYPILFKGPAGTCAHEFILDLRPLKDTAGVEVCCLCLCVACDF